MVLQYLEFQNFALGTMLTNFWLSIPRGSSTVKLIWSWAEAGWHGARAVQVEELPRRHTHTHMHAHTHGSPAGGAGRWWRAPQSRRVPEDGAFTIQTVHIQMVSRTSLHTPCHGPPWEACHTPSDKYATCPESVLKILSCMWLFNRTPSCFRSFSL